VPNFDFFVNSTTFQSSVPYGTNAIVAVNCAFATTFGIGEAGVGQIDTANVPQLRCGGLYTFFAARKRDTQGNNGNPNTPNYQVIAIELAPAPAGSTANYVPGYVFHMIYNRAEINIQYCDGTRSDCTRNNGRKNQDIQTAQAQSVNLMYTNNFENPVTINELYDNVVVNSYNTYSYWLFYGDNNRQDQFPIVGAGGASMLTVSLGLIALLNLAVLFA